MDTRCHPGPSLSPSEASKTPSRQTDAEAAQRLLRWGGRTGSKTTRHAHTYPHTHTHTHMQTLTYAHTLTRTCTHAPINTLTHAHAPMQQGGRLAGRSRQPPAPGAGHSAGQPAPMHVFTVQIHTTQERAVPRLRSLHKAHRYTHITNTNSPKSQAHTTQSRQRLPGSKGHIHLSDTQPPIHAHTRQHPDTYADSQKPHTLNP